MPIYEYTCQECGSEFEHLHRSGEEAACPSCGQTRLTKRFSVPAAHSGGSSEPSCGAAEAGLCNPGGCCGQGCGLPPMG